MERKLILDVLNKTGGNKSKAAELLGITREGLRKKLLRMGINDKEPPSRRRQGLTFTGLNT